MIDVRIMAHPSRADNVKVMLQDLKLSDEIVVWDDRINGGDAMYTARKAWLYPITDGCTHRIVLQDDAELCDGFLTIVEKVAEKYDDSIVSFFHMETYVGNNRYEQCNLGGGIALMMPVKMIYQFFDYVDKGIYMHCTRDLAERILKADTISIRSWMKHEHIPCVTTVPSLVQHLGNVSLVGIDRKRVALDYTKNPPTTGW